MISERIFDDIPPQMTNLKMVIPSKVYLTFTHQNQAFWRKNISCVSDVYSLRRPITSDFAHDVEFLKVYHRIYCHKFLT